MQKKLISFDEISQLSSKDKAYFRRESYLNSFLTDFPSVSSILNQAKDKKASFTSEQRTLLVDVLKKQYAQRSLTQRAEDSMNALLDENTFTIITAHQPSLLTGPLYYIYKIISVLKLSRHLNNQQNDFTFIPLFITGGEDHDFDEINHAQIFNKRLEWDTKQSGAVGRMEMSGLSELIVEFKDLLGERSKAINLVNEIQEKLASFTSYASFTIWLTERLFIDTDLLIINMDDKDLKQSFIPILKKELTESFSKPLVNDTQTALAEHNHQSQAFARDINLFMHSDNQRLRIEKNGEQYHLVDSTTHYTESEILQYLNDHPENFSPNVVLRPLYQEHCMPNVAYVGGGGELSYWLERKSQFEAIHLPFPILVRRHSALIIEAKDGQTWQQLGFNIEDIFEEEHILIKSYLTRSSEIDLDLEPLLNRASAVYNELSELSNKVDPTLSKSIQAASVKHTKSLEQLGSRITRALKAKEEVSITKIKKIKAKYFPNNGLQERYTNVFEFISKYGITFISKVEDSFEDFPKEFEVIMLEKDDFPA